MLKRLSCILTLLSFVLMFPSCDRNQHYDSSRDQQDIHGISPFIQSTVPLQENPAMMIRTGNEETEYYIPGYAGEKVTPPSRMASRKASLKEGLVDRTVSFASRGFLKRPCIRVPSPVLQVHFDNDIYANTDYYFTSGLELSLYHPATAHFPGALLLAGGGQGSIGHYGIRIVQNLYTPVDPDQYEIQYGDRPFASYLLVGIRRVSLYPHRSLRVTAGLDVGVIGPAAMGGFVQRTVHQYEPVGWSNQVSNDLAIIYQVTAAKGLLIREGLELWASAGGMAGTLYDNLSGGILFKLGRFEPSSTALSPAEGTTCRKIQFFISAELKNTLVLYDATLQGGMFNRTSVYTLSPDDLRRYVAEAIMSVGFAYGRTGLQLSQHFNTAEFAGARSHAWGRITLEYRL